MSGFNRLTSRLAPRAKGAVPPPPQDGEGAPATAELPVREETKHDRGRNAFFSRGQYLARQDRWDMLGRLVAETDRSRLTTPAGIAMAALLADGARSDAVKQARSAISDGNRDLPEGIIALEEVAEEHEATWGVSLIVARAQIECAWAYEGQVDPYALPRAATPDFIRRFQAAGELVEAIAGRAGPSAEVAALRCDLLAADPHAAARVDTMHDRAIATDPQNPGRLRAYGVALLPRWYGTHDRLELTALAMARDHREEDGEAAYTWMWFDALRLDPAAAAAMDPGRFVAGMHDILTARPVANLANLMAAYAAGMAPALAPDDLGGEARAARAEIHAALPELIDEHLTELHPQVWARADSLPGTSHPGPLSAGRIAAATAQARQAVRTAGGMGPGPRTGIDPAHA